MALNQRVRAATESLSFVSILVAILVALNVIGVFVFQRLDLTEQQIFSLSEGSERVAHSLADRMEVTAYFTEDLPPPFNATERYVRDLLAEYEAASGGKVHVRFVHPDEDEERQAAERDGVVAVPHQVIVGDEISRKEGYRGVVLKYLDQKKTLPVIEDTAGLEYKLTLAMKEISGDKQSIGIVKDMGELTLSKGLSTLQKALPLYTLKEVSADEPIPSDLVALLIVAPDKKLSESALRNINRYVMDGGSLGVFGGAAKVELETQDPTATSVETGLNELLKAWGVKLENGIVADAQCARTSMPGPLGLSVVVPYPPVPQVTFDEEQQEHPALFQISSVRFPFPSPLEVTDALKNTKDAAVRVLARSTDRSWLMEGDTVSLRTRDPRDWTLSDEVGPFVLAAAIEGKVPSAFSTSSASGGAAAPAVATRAVRIFVTGSGSLLRDELLPNPDQRGAFSAGAMAFILNAIDWLAQEQDLVAIRAKTVEDPALEIPADVASAEQVIEESSDEAVQAAQGGDRGTAQKAIKKREKALERLKEANTAWQAKKNIYRWGNTLGVPILFAAFGLVRWRRRQSKKDRIKL